MTAPQSRGPSGTSISHRELSRRELLSAAGAVAAGAGALAATSTAVAGPAASASAGVPVSVRVAAVSYSPPFHDHRAGVDLSVLRTNLEDVMRERPNFVCYPEVCACIGGGFQKGIESAPALEPFAEAVGRLAREFNVALVVPFIERQGSRVYNSVPIVNRQGELVMVYRKNYPTTGELEEGITPGHEIPVAECDGVRVGAAVCFDLNFDNVAAELGRQQARLVFWPSMYWGGALLQHWSRRYGFATVAAYGAESSIIDMNGRCVIQRGTQSVQVRNGNMSPWAVADVYVNRDLYHLDLNMKKFSAIRGKYGADVLIEPHDPEAFCVITSLRPDLPIETLAAEFELETLRDYLARSVKLRNSKLPG